MQVREALYRQIPSMFLRMQDILGNKIVGGSFDVEPFPNEAELAKQFKSTLNTAREVIELLGSKGLLYYSRGHRPVVQSPHFWNLVDPDILKWLQNRALPPQVKIAQYQMRQAIQPAAAGLAAKHRDIASIRSISHTLELLNASKTFDKLLEADVNFQINILEASLNPMFARLKNLVSADIGLANEYYLQIRNGSFIDVSQYNAIMRAIEAGDSEDAEGAMRLFLHKKISVSAQEVS